MKYAFVTIKQVYINSYIYTQISLVIEKKNETQL